MIWGQANIKHLEYRDDRFVAAIAVDKYRPTTLLYLARAVTPGSYQVPPPQVESMYVPYWRAVGATKIKLMLCLKLDSPFFGKRAFSFE